MGIEAWTITGDFLRIAGGELPANLKNPRAYSTRGGNVLVPISSGEVGYPNHDPWTEPPADAADIATFLRDARQANRRVELIRGCRMQGEGMDGTGFNEYFTRQPIDLTGDQMDELSMLPFGDRFASRVTELVGNSPPIRAGANGTVR